MRGVLKPLKKLGLPERTEVRMIIRGSFSKLIEELREIEAKEDVDEVLGRMRNRNYEGVLDTSTIIKSIFNKRAKKRRIKRDFTFAKYVELCDEKIRESDYTLHY